MPITSGFSAQDLARMGPDPLTRKRMLAEALLAKGMSQRKIEHPLQGAAQVAEALVGGLQMRKLDQAQKWGQDHAQASMNELGAALAGPSAFPEAPGTAAKPMSPAYGDQRVSSAHGGAIRDGLIKRGLPEHIADAFVMNFKDESGLNPGINEANPTVPGSRGGFGLAQWTGPRRKALEAFAQQQGADVADPELQLDFLMTELQGPEAQAAQSIMAAPDSGQAAAAIVNNFLRPAEQHRASREARYLAGDAPASQGAPQNPQLAQALIAPNNAGNVGMPGQGGIVQAQGAFPEAPADPAATLGARPMPKGGPDIQMLMGAAGNPWMNPQQMGIIEALIGQKLSPKKFDFLTGKDGSIFRGDPTSGSIDQVYGGKPDTFRVLSNEEEAKFGLDPAGAYQIGADNKVSKIGGEGTTVNIDQKTEGAFDKKLAEKDAETYSTMSTEGMNAKADLGIIGELGTLLEGQGGTMTGLQGWLAQKGIDVGEATSDLQAAQALINKLVPTQRQPGSGSMSDRDVELFTRSLPSLWNQPGGNQKILGVMKGLAEYKAEQGRISDGVLTNEITRQEARKMLQALPNPLAEFTKANAAPSRKAPIVIDGYTIEEVE